jgi:hypothetical protein
MVGLKFEILFAGCNRNHIQKASKFVFAGHSIFNAIKRMGAYGLSRSIS